MGLGNFLIEMSRNFIGTSATVELFEASKPWSSLVKFLIDIYSLRLFTSHLFPRTEISRITYCCKNFAFVSLAPEILIIPTDIGLVFGEG